MAWTRVMEVVSLGKRVSVGYDGKMRNEGRRTCLQ